MRKYLIINAEEIDKIDYSQVSITDETFLIYSLDRTKTFIKWDTEEDPTFVADLIFKEGPYNNAEILEILQGPVWYDPSQHI
jgi:hypothetical protein